MTREPPHLSRAPSIEDDDHTNGHGPETDPPPRPRGPRLSTEEQVARHGSQLDAILDDTRSLRRWTISADERLHELGAGLERLELGLFEVLGLAKKAEDRAAKADARAQRAERDSSVAREEASRSSQTNEVATHFVQRKLELDVRADEDSLAARRKRNALLFTAAKTFVTALIAAIIGVIFAKGCH
jgi:hypothetical protein